MRYECPYLVEYLDYRRKPPTSLYVSYGGGQFDIENETHRRIVIYRRLKYFNALHTSTTEPGVYGVYDG